MLLAGWLRLLVLATVVVTVVVLADGFLAVVPDGEMVAG